MRKSANFLRDLVTSVLWGCWHPRAAWPLWTRQWCPDCGAHRQYELGGQRGPWRRWIKLYHLQRLPLEVRP
jgi:hypothetical protein